MNTTKRKILLELSEPEPETVGISLKRANRIKIAMQRFIDSGYFPGFQTVIARHGKIAYSEVQGFANLEEKEPLASNTIFRIYSMTKPITVVTVMMLYEEGHFLLDDPVANFLPEFEQMQVFTKEGRVEAKNPITIRQLLTHTSGLNYGFYSDDSVALLYRQSGLNDGDARTSGLTTEEYVKRLAQLPLYANPGTTWRYGEAMAVLGRLVEVITGQSFRDFLKLRLLDPLGMVDTDFYVPNEKLNRLATLYEIVPRGLSPIDILSSDDYAKRPIQGSDYGEQPTFESGGAGLVSTAADYLRFAQMLLNGGELEGTRILSPTTVKLMMSDHLRGMYGERPLANLQAPIVSGRGLGFGFGGFVVNDAVAWGMGSNGLYAWGGAASTFFWIDPYQDLVGMILTQVVPDNIYPTSQRMVQMTYQALIGD